MSLPTANPLVIALAAGQPDAYADLYDRLGRSLLRVAGVMLRSASEAEDAVQDVFVELVRHRDQLRQVQDLDAYVFSMLRHAVGHRLRRLRTEQHHLRQVIPVTTEKLDPDLPDHMQMVLKSLPSEQREVIALKIDGDLTFAQIAAILDVNPNTAASRYRYAIEKLRPLLEQMR